MFKEQFSKMSAFRKRAFAVALSAAVVSTSFNIGTYAVEGGSSANGRVITAFETLPEDILYQYLPVGAKESDINFPEELNVTLYSDTEEKTEEKQEEGGDIVIEEPENPSDEPTGQDDGTTESGAGESDSDETVDTDAGNTDNGNTEADAGNTDTGAGSTDTGADTGSTETGTTEPGAGAGETLAEESPETSDETGGEGAGEGNTESGTSEEAANDEGSQEGSQEEGGSSEPSDETAVDESAIQGIRSTAAAVIRAFKPVTVYAAENEDGGEETEGGESQSAGEEGGEGENKENEGDAQTEGGAENTDNNGNNELTEGSNENSEQPAAEPENTENTGDNTETVDNGNTDNNGEAAAPEEESGSSEDGNSDVGNSDAENTDNNTDEGITELSDGEARVLRDVNWKLVRDESTYSKFQAVLEGDVFVYEPKISEYGLKSDVELPKIRVTIVAAEETVSEDTVSEDTVSEDAVSENSPAFSQMMIVGGVRVTVEAPEGVFPEGAVLHVKKLEGENLEKAESYVREDMGVDSESSEDEDGEGEEGSNQNLQMVFFDVTITDTEGNEIQPNTEFGEATIKFANVDIVRNYLEAQEGEASEGSDKGAELKVYHFDENMENAETPEVQVDGGDKAVTVSAEHFSGYGISVSAVNIETSGVYEKEGYTISWKGLTIDFFQKKDGDKIYAFVKSSLEEDSDSSITVSGNGSTPIQFFAGNSGFKSEPIGAPVEVILKNLTMELDQNMPSHCLDFNGFKDMILKPQTVSLKHGTANSCYGPVRLINTNCKLIQGECINELEGDRDIFMTEGSSLVIDTDGEISPSSTSSSLLLSSFNAGGAVLGNGYDKFTVEGGKIDINGEGGRIGCAPLDASKSGDSGLLSSFEIKGGFVNWNPDDKYFTENRKPNVPVQISGGTHGGLAFNVLLQSNSKIFTITGGSVKYSGTNNNIEAVVDDEGKPIKGCTCITFVGADNSPITNTKVTGIYNGAGDRIEYGLNDVYTDGAGKVYLWLSSPDIGYATLDGSEIKYVSEKGANSTASANGGANADTTFIPYTNPLKSVEIGTLTNGTNKLKDITTLVYENGTGDEASSSNKFRDISWEVEVLSASGNYAIRDNLSDDAVLDIRAAGEYKIKAIVKDAATGSREVGAKTFTYKYDVKDVKCISSNEASLTTLSFNSGHTYKLKDGAKSGEFDFKFMVDPDGAYYTDMSFSVKPESGGTMLGSVNKLNENGTLSLAMEGTYKLTVSVNDGNNKPPYKFPIEVTSPGDRNFKISTEGWKFVNDPLSKLENNFTVTASANNGEPVKYRFASVGDKLPKSIDDIEDVGKLDFSSFDSENKDTDGFTELAKYDDVKLDAGNYIAFARQKINDAYAYSYSFFEVKGIEASDVKDYFKANDRIFDGESKDSLSIKNASELYTKFGLSSNDFIYEYDNKSYNTSIPQTMKAGPHTISVNHPSLKESFEITQTISPKSLRNIPTTGFTITDAYYTGDSVVAGVTIDDGDYMLVEGTDYELNFAKYNNVNIGRGTVDITGKNNYTGTVTKYFNIKKFDGTLTLLYDGSSTQKDSYKNSVKISTSENFYVSDKASGPFDSTVYPITGEGKITKTLYFKEQSTGAIISKSVTVYIDIDTPVYYNGSEEKQDWYTEDVKLTTDKSQYTISTSKSGTFSDSITVTKSGTTTLYFKDKSTGEVISNTVSVTLNIDTKAPTGKIEAVSKSWKKFQGTEKTVAYTNEQKSITITGSDSDSKVKTLEYYISDEFISSEKTLENKVTPVTKIVTDDGTVRTVVQNSNWSTYNSKSKPGLSKDALNYIYAKVTDNAGNIFYMSSEGIWYDTKAPKVTSAKATPKDTSTTVKVTATDTKGSGVKYVYVLVKKKDESKPTAKTVQSSGKRKELSKDDGKDDFEITGLTAKTGYVVYTVAEDFCKNLSEVKETKITTKESSSSSSSGTGGKSGANGAAGAGGAGAGGSNSAKRGVSSDSAKNGKGGAGGSASENGGEGDSDKIRNKVPFIDDASEGVLTGREYTSGWDKIENETLAADAPAEIHIDMNGATVVPAKLLNGFANRDVTVYLEMGDGLVWAVNGLSFTSTPEKDIDFKVKKNTKNIPSKILTEVADVYPHTNLTLSHDGDFGFTAIMSLDMGADNSGMFGNLYYYNEDAGSLEFIDSQEIGGSGNVQFEFTHASDYTVIVRGDALTEKTAAALTVENSDSDMRDYSGSSRVSGAANVAKRSNHLWLLIISIISILLCGFILFMPDKKKWGK